MEKVKGCIHGVWYGFNVNLIKIEKDQKIKINRESERVCTLVYGINSILTWQFKGNNANTPQQERLLVDTLVREGVCVCARLWFNCGDNIMYKCDMDVFMTKHLSRRGCQNMVKCRYTMGAQVLRVHCDVQSGVENSEKMICNT